MSVEKKVLDENQTEDSKKGFDPITFVRERGLLILQAACGAMAVMCTFVAFVENQEQNYDVAVFALKMAGICTIVAYISVLGSTPLFNEDSNDKKAKQALRAKWVCAVFFGAGFGMYFYYQALAYETATKGPVVITGSESQIVSQIDPQDLSFYVRHTIKEKAPLPELNVMPILTTAGLGKKETRIDVDGRVYKETLGVLTPYKYNFVKSSWTPQCDLKSSFKKGIGQEGFSIKDYLICVNAAVTPCVADPVTAIATPCKCVVTSKTADCGKGKFCYDGICQATPKIGVKNCAADRNTKAIVEKCRCSFDSMENECDKDKYCWSDGKCEAAAESTRRNLRSEPVFEQQLPGGDLPNFEQQLPGGDEERNDENSEPGPGGFPNLNPQEGNQENRGGNIPMGEGGAGGFQLPADFDPNGPPEQIFEHLCADQPCLEPCLVKHPEKREQCNNQFAQQEGLLGASDDELRALQDLPPASGAPFYKADREKGECMEIASMDDQCDGGLVSDFLTKFESFEAGQCPDEFSKIKAVETEYYGIRGCATIAFRVLKKAEPTCTGEEDEDPCGAHGNCDTKSGTCFCNKGYTGKLCKDPQGMPVADFCSKIQSDEKECGKATDCCTWEKGFCNVKVGKTTCFLPLPASVAQEEESTSSAFCQNCIEQSKANGLCNTLFEFGITNTNSKLEGKKEKEFEKALQEVIPSSCNTQCLEDENEAKVFQTNALSSCYENTCKDLGCNKIGGCILREGTATQCRVNPDMFTDEQSCAEFGGPGSIYCGALAKKRNCDKCITPFLALNGCDKYSSETVTLPTNCNECETEIMEACGLDVKKAAVNDAVAGFEEECENCVKHDFRWQVDFKDRNLFECKKFLGLKQCNTVNLYFVFSSNDYEFVNVDFQSSMDRSGQTRRNLVQSDNHLKSTYALGWLKETSLTGSVTSTMNAELVRYGEEPQGFAKGYVKISFTIPTKAGKAIIHTSTEQLPYTINMLWTSVIATSSLVGGLFMFFFPNIMHKSYFRFAEWRPIVSEGEFEKRVPEGKLDEIIIEMETPKPVENVEQKVVE